MAGWIGTGTITWLHIPGWMGTWFSLFNNWQTFLAQFIALLLVIGSYLGAQYLRLWRPRRRGRHPATPALQIPYQPADLAAGGTPATGI